MWPKDIWGTSQELEKKHMRWILTSWNIFHFQRGQGCAWGSPQSLWLSESLGQALLNHTDPDQLLPSLQEISISSGLGTQSYSLNYAVGMFISGLAFWTHPCPVPSPTSCPCLLDGPWKCLVTLSGQRLLVRFIAVTPGLCPMLRPCGTATLPVRAWPVLGHLCPMAQPCSHCSCRDSVYTLWEIPSEKFSQAI